MHVVLNVDEFWLNAAHKKFCVHTYFKKLEGTLIEWLVAYHISTNMSVQQL